MDVLGKQFREIFKSNDIKIGMTELAKVTGVSPSQLRYWERKGYICSQQDQQNKNHHFSILTAYQVRTIKFYLDEGYTLQLIGLSGLRSYKKLRSEGPGPLGHDYKACQ